MIQKHLSLNKNKTPNPIKERLRDRLQITLLTLRELKRLTLSSSIPYRMTNLVNNLVSNLYFLAKIFQHWFKDALLDTSFHKMVMLPEP